MQETSSENSTSPSVLLWDGTMLSLKEYGLSLVPNRRPSLLIWYKNLWLGQGSICFWNNSSKSSGTINLPLNLLNLHLLLPMEFLYLLLPKHNSDVWYASSGSLFSLPPLKNPHFTFFLLLMLLYTPPCYSVLLLFSFSTAFINSNPCLSMKISFQALHSRGRPVQKDQGQTRIFVSRTDRDASKSGVQQPLHFLLV